MTRHYSAALPIAYVALRILIVLNWFSGAAILALLGATVIAPDWTVRALGIGPDSWIMPVLPGLRFVAALGAASVPLYDAILRRLVAIVLTVRMGDPFVPANAVRLTSIAWIVLVLQLIGIVIGAIGKMLSTPAHPVHLDAGFSTGGWLAVLLTFILARIFAEGTAMREDLEGTV